MALSTCEAEYMALTQACKEAVWLRLLLTELGMVTKSILLKPDNQGAIALAKNPEFHNRTKHAGIQYHFCRQEIEAGRIRVEFLAQRPCWQTA